MLQFNLKSNSSAVSASLNAKKQQIAAKQTELAQKLAQNLKEYLKDELNYSSGAAGQPPHSLGGLLAQSMDCEVSSSENEVSLKAGDLYGKAPYAMYLEYGTVSIAARPFLLPALSVYSQLLSDGVKNIAEDL